MYKENRGLVEWSLDSSFDYEIIDICNKFNLDSKQIQYFSQQDEDKYIIQYILKNPILDGTFLELGACDGVLYSNTKTLEDYFNFNGILIEPVGHYYNKLKENRPNQKKYNCVVSNLEDNLINFSGFDAESGITEFLNKNSKENNYKVENKKLSQILNDSGFEYIDIMIIDVEGAELSVIESIDFNFPIYCIFFETPSDQQEKNKKVGSYLKEKGFLYKERQRGNEVWYNPSYFRRNLFKL